LGQITFAEWMDYTAIGTVTNLAARRGSAPRRKTGRGILVSRHVAIAVADSAQLGEGICR
jgi:class 3 adenylate cyclase